MVRKLAFFAVILAISVTGAFVVNAAIRESGEKNYRITRQAYQWRTRPVSTSSTTFTPLPFTGAGSGQGVPVPQPLTIAARGGMSATVSGDFSGAPVEIRVRDGRRLFHPGRTHFDPTTGTTSFSFTFVTPGSKYARCHALRVGWRSPSGQSVTMNRGDFVVTYRDDNTRGERRFGCV